MTVKELEARVKTLEQQVKQLRSEVAAAKTSANKSWLAAVERFAGDEDLLSIFADARKLREQDRRKTRGQTPSKPKSRS